MKNYLRFMLKHSESILFGLFLAIVCFISKLYPTAICMSLMVAAIITVLTTCYIEDHKDNID